MELETFLDWKNKKPIAGSIISTPRRTDIIINGVSPTGGGGRDPRPAPTPSPPPGPGRPPGSVGGWE